MIGKKQATIVYALLIGRHRYFHKLYALDTVLPNLKQPAKAKLKEAMEAHVILRAEQVGLYQRK
jgi:phosphatidylethanolamine-binding protein (PEBP) family uncharacterized protein